MGSIDIIIDDKNNLTVKIKNLQYNYFFNERVKSNAFNLLPINIKFQYI